MTEVIVRGLATRWVDDDFPGWIEVVIVDANGHQHRVVDKVPVLTTRQITAADPFPTELWLAADMTSVHGEQVDVILRAGVETQDGSRRLTVATNDVVWL